MSCGRCQSATARSCGPSANVFFGRGATVRPSHASHPPPAPMPMLSRAMALRQGGGGQGPRNTLASPPQPIVSPAPSAARDAPHSHRPLTVLRHCGIPQGPQGGAGLPGGLRLCAFFSNPSMRPGGVRRPRQTDAVLYLPKNVARLKKDTCTEGTETSGM